MKRTYVVNDQPLKLSTGSSHTVQAKTYIRGQLLWIQGVPMPDTEVALVDEEGNELGDTTTDEEGFYEFEGAYPDAVAIQCDSFEEKPDRGLHIQVIDEPTLTPARQRCSRVHRIWGAMQRRNGRRWRSQAHRAHRQLLHTVNGEACPRRGHPTEGRARFARETATVAGSTS